MSIINNELKDIIVISAPSGAGKTTIVKKILQKYSQLSFSISATTRKQRSNEVNGIDYFFLTDNEFQNQINNNGFIEWEMVYEGLKYGTLKSELTNIWNKNKIPLLEVDVKGAIRIKKENFNIKVNTIFINIPSIEILKERLIKRGTENIETINTRIKKAEFEIGYASQFDYIVENNNLEECFFNVEEIIKKIIEKK